MATSIQLNIGNNPVVYTGTSALSLASQPWYTSANVSRIFAVSANGLGYTNGTPGSNFGVTQLAPASAGNRPSGYIIVAKQAFVLDASLFGASPTRLVFSFPPTNSGAPTVFPVVTILADQAGTYALPVSDSGLMNLSYTKNGSTAAGTVTLAPGDLLGVTGTTGTGVGTLTLLKQ